MVGGCGSTPTATLPGTAAASGGSATSATTTATPSLTPTAADKPSTKELIDKVKSALSTAKSMRISGTVPYQGKAMKMDMAGTMDGSNQRFLVTMPEMSVELLTVGGKTYARIDASGSGKPTGKWLAASPEMLTGLDKMNLNAVVRPFLDEVNVGFLDEVNTQMTDTTEAGRPAWKVTQKVGGKGEALIVSADGKYELMRISDNSGSSLAFTEWNAVKPFAAPAASEVGMT